MEERVLGAMEDFPYAGPTLSCEELIAADPLKGRPEGSEPQDAQDIDRSIRCGNAELHWHTRATEKMKAWSPKVGKVLLDGNRFAGVEIHITRGEPRTTAAESVLDGIASGGGQWSAGCGDAGFAGKQYVAPENGITVDGYELGWGLANLSFRSPNGPSYDNDRYYPTLYVHRQVSLHEVDVEIRMGVLAEDDVPEEYLALTKERCP